MCPGTIMQKMEIDSAFVFKQCSLCHTVWETKDHFLNDPEIRLNGYQFTGRNFVNSHRGGMLVFTHHRSTCGTTLAVYARQLKDFEQELQEE
jgi:hypothetical protein